MCVTAGLSGCWQSDASVVAWQLSHPLYVLLLGREGCWQLVPPAPAVRKARLWYACGWPARCWRHVPLGIAVREATCHVLGGCLGGSW